MTQESVFLRSQPRPQMTTLMHATDSQKPDSSWASDWRGFVLCVFFFFFLIFLLYFLGQPLPSKLFSQLDWVSKSVACMSWTAGVALNWESRHWARLDWILGRPQTSGGATCLSDVRCWELRKANATADGFLQPCTGTVAPAASPGYPGSPTGKAGQYQDPTALQD